MKKLLQDIQKEFNEIIVERDELKRRRPDDWMFTDNGQELSAGIRYYRELHNNLLNNVDVINDRIKSIKESYDFGFITPMEFIAQIDEVFTEVGNVGHQMIFTKFFKKVNEIVAPIAEEMIKYIEQ